LKTTVSREPCIGAIVISTLSDQPGKCREFSSTDIDGMWYLRIRQPELMSMPLEGVVKLECYAVDPSEKEIGLDADRIDNISRFILQERNVTPYQSDGRWASHIYPIYMAETYLKRSFRSDAHFKALF
jgi:hypothetical protein